MGLGSLIRKLTGSGDAQEVEAEAVEYQGYMIRPAPRKEGPAYYTAGIISKALEDGTTQQHSFVRADTHSSQEAASQHAITKAKQIIDERGDRIFDTG